jgi:hypothetical protein
MQHADALDFCSAPATASLPARMSAHTSTLRGTTLAPYPGRPRQGGQCPTQQHPQRGQPPCLVPTQPHMDIPTSSVPC